MTSQIRSGKQTCRVDLSGSYRMRIYDSLVSHWAEYGLVPAEKLRQGLAMQIESKGFWLLDLAQER